MARVLPRLSTLYKPEVQQRAGLRAIIVIE
jgi:hypothetical protein